MGLLSCSCGNVKLYTSTNDDILTEFTFPPNCRNLPELDPFFSHVSIQRFGVGGAKMEQPYLSVNRRVETWLILRCLNCEMDVFASEDAFVEQKNRALGEGLILVSCALSCGQEEIANINTQPNYSNVFNFCVRPELYPSVLPADFAEHQEYLEFYSELQNKVNQKFKEEENATKERIRKYTQEQEELLSNFHKKADRDKALIFNTARSIAFRKQEENDALYGNEVNNTSEGQRRNGVTTEEVNFNEAVVPGSLRTVSRLEEDVNLNRSHNPKQGQRQSVRHVVFEPVDTNMDSSSKGNSLGKADKTEDVERFVPEKALQDEEKVVPKTNVIFSLDGLEDPEDNVVLNEESSSESDLDDSLEYTSQAGANLYSQSVPVQIPYLNGAMGASNNISDRHDGLEVGSYTEEGRKLQDIAKSMHEMASEEDVYDPFPRRRKFSLV